MDQFTREVDEEYRRAQMAALWKRFGSLIVSVLVVVIVGVAGYTWWEARETQRAEAASLALYEASSLSADGRTDEARAVLDGLVEEAPGATAILARLRLAALSAQTDTAAGVAAYEAIAADTSAPAVLRDLARLRAALLQIDSAPDTALPVLQSLAAGEGAFRHTAREQLGLAALDRGDYDAAGEWFDQIAVDPQTPGALRQRLAIYSALVAAGPLGGAN
ncbi:tetratricopeptide repeat protein [Salinarimonas ramus]|uniref:Ancillary SecYEG translocon subunit n=1 Tax=Salinarimonas ramus TaxID=690164 RepID=A0A917Q4W4_9HYPH|nr:tetratricopeptide repeat protein [Salinarimonas ramus]GGK22774.1 membrane protein [Salinarimonas ramus]